MSKEEITDDKNENLNLDELDGVTGGLGDYNLVRPGGLGEENPVIPKDPRGSKDFKTA